MIRVTLNQIEWVVEHGSSENDYTYKTVDMNLNYDQAVLMMENCGYLKDDEKGLLFPAQNIISIESY